MDIKENNKIYLSPNIFLFKNSYYYFDDLTKKNIKINKKNWNKYLEELEWEKLEIGWRKRLKSKEHNSLYGVLDCGGEGDCLFNCISEAFKNFYKPEDDSYSPEEIRKIISYEINDNNFDIIIENYRLEVDTNEFDGFWNPYLVKNKEDLQNEIVKMGNSFWGDHILIQLLEKALNINVIILNSENDFFGSQKFKIQSTGNEFVKERRSIILSYCLNSHFQLIGYFNGNRMTKIFNFEQIPKELIKIYEKDCRKII
jgi:hypothetical protein